MIEQNAPNLPKPEVPAKAWIRFLRTYGPTPNNATMFDEHVSKAAKVAKVVPIELPIPLLPSILSHLHGVIGGSVIIAGTAGDGKTYHCRALWKELGGDPNEWNQSGAVIKSLTLKNGKHIYFVKDLSELNELDGNFIFELLEQSVLKNDDQKILIIAANHGQILERLRKRVYEDQKVHPLRTALEEVFLQTGTGHTRLKVFDLSQSSHRKSLTDVLDVLVNHPEWEKCQNCYFQIKGKNCPIYENRNRLLGLNEESERLRSRMADLIDLARLNGAHLPVRDLLALCANIILGHPYVKDGLMRCEDVEKIIIDDSFFRGSIYDNLMGANLPNHRVAERPAFQALASFQIGIETTSQIDGLLVYGPYDNDLASLYQRLMQTDPIYGATTYFRARQDLYFEGDEFAREDANDEIISLLKSQRRRLFFMMDSTEFSENYFWNLSAYQNAGLYITLLRSLENNIPIKESTRQVIVCGLNRIMTGMLIDDSEKIFVATSGGFTESKVSVLCKEEIPSRPSRRSHSGMIVRLNSNQKPCLEFRFTIDEETGVLFELSPLRFEFIARVAAGVLPNSFSSECLEDLLALKSKLLRRVELLSNEDYVDEVPEIIDDNLQISFINDSGLNGVKNIFVRLPK